MMVNQSGEVKSYDDYYPFGMTMAGRSSVTIEPKYRFTGKEKSEATGHYLFGARTYNPLIGRWDQVDPLDGEYLGLSPYNYVQNNPMKTIDPDGRDGWDVLFGFADAVTEDFSGNDYENTSDVKDRGDYGAGRTVGHIFSLVVGSAGEVAGALTAGVGGVSLGVSGGLSAEVSVPAMAAGGLLAVKSGKVATNASNNLMSEENKTSGQRTKNRLPDKGDPNTVQKNAPETTAKKYGPDGNVQKEYNAGHGKNAPKKERGPHMHDYKPNPNNPTGKGSRQPGRPPKKNELKKDFDM